jgi:cytidine deaminase
MKNGVFWDVTPCGSCKNRRFGGTWRLHYQSDKNRGTRNNVVRFEFSTAVTMKSGVFWDVMPCGSCKNRRFGGT